MILPLLLLACTGKDEPVDSAAPWVFPELDAAPGLRGPGGPTVAFDSDALWQNCAGLLGGDEDVLHHNLVMPYRGHLVLPWAPEFGGGGISFFEVADPCNPVRVGNSFSRFMRETHAIGFLHLPDDDPQAGDYAAVTGNLGVQIWDITDITAAEPIAYLQLPNVFYPDSYARVVLSVFWQHPWLFVAAADNGVYVVDTSSLTEPEHVGGYSFDPVLRAGGVFALGSRLLVTSAEGNQVAVLDISYPDDPQPIPGGLFTLTDGSGTPTEAYHGNLVGHTALFARKEGGGGVIAWDISDPSNPTYLTEGFSEGGNGGYVFYDEGYAFVGDSHWGRVYDLRDPDAVVEVGTGNLPGDLDTFVPYGNVGVLSVDEDAEDETASAIVPWTTAVDDTPPALLAVDPPDGATGVATTARVGLGFNEPVEPGSAFPGSVRLYDDAGLAVPGFVSVQETIVTYAPKEPLKPGTTYTVELLQGGITDINSNALAAPFTATFTTAGAR
ncbi:MAG: Ig-like domain-containing protein [Alphaproteobacteria bacterium]|nr:Ig-like domain-containing protein [Alphaproteobacteria bacterium]